MPVYGLEISVIIPKQYISHQFLNCLCIILGAPTPVPSDEPTVKPSVVKPTADPTLSPSFAPKSPTPYPTARATVVNRHWHIPTQEPTGHKHTNTRNPTPSREYNQIGYERQPFMLFIWV